MKKLTFLLLLLTLTIYSQTKKVCFSIDDLPLVNYGIEDTSLQIRMVENLIGSLIKYNIPAIGFVNENKLYNDSKIIPYRQKMLEDWVTAGLDLGNHTYSHPSYHRVDLNTYSADLLKGEIVTKKLLAKNGKEIKYFRNPFLHTGNTKEKSDSLIQFLTKHNYVTAPVTIDNEDYLFALSYKRAWAKNDHKLMEKIGADYVSYMEAKLIYFENQSNKLFNRKIDQILLLHSSQLNSDYIDELAEMFIKNDYQFVSMDEILEDEVYDTKVTRFSNWGISWLDRWALSMGKKGEFFKDEPLTPDYIVKMSKR